MEDLNSTIIFFELVDNYNTYAAQKAAEYILFKNTQKIHQDRPYTEP